MKNHICQFDSNVYKQRQGGAIGVGIAGDIATLFMVWWDRELKSRLRRQSIEIQLYKTYVDDTNLVAKTVPNASKQPNDKVTMETIQKIANEIHPSISVTIDFPTNHTNNKMPVLDLELWIDMVEVGSSMKRQILFTHYMKPMANKYLINNRSALSTTMKTNVLVADLVRIMRNVSLQCSESERQKHIQHFIKRMQFSGYHQQERVKVYTKAKRRFEQIIERDRKGECPIYRGKFWERRRREQEKIKKKRTWYAKGGYETVLFVDATPNGELAKECQQILKESELKIKTVERAGRSLKESLVKSDPFKTKTCKESDCQVCKMNPKANCKVRDVVYEMSCLGSEEDGPCRETYIGESARSLKERINEHIDKYEKKDKSSVLYKHMQEKHGERKQQITVQVLTACPGDPMLRQVSEAVYIQELSPTLNSKEEWGNTNIPRRRRNNNNRFLNDCDVEGLEDVLNICD